MYYINDIVSPFHFVGTYNSNTTYTIGDLCTRDDDIYVFTGTTWEEIGACDNFNSHSHSEEITITTQCRNCGAPTNDEGKCPYCGTYNHKIIKKYI